MKKFSFAALAVLCASALVSVASSKPNNFVASGDLQQIGTGNEMSCTGGALGECDQASTTGANNATRALAQEATDYDSAGGLTGTTNTPF